jgi:hypothetical protein
MDDFAARLRRLADANELAYGTVARLFLNL